jgi:hypothetical protein
LIIAALISAFSVCCAQQCEVPSFYSLKTEADYRKNEEKAIACMKWLSGESLNANPAQRSKALLYVMLWLQGSPTIRVETYSEFLIFEETNPEYLAEFIYLLALSQLSDSSLSEKEHHVNAIASLINLYEISEGPEGPSPDWLLHLRSVNLPSWVEEQFLSIHPGR